MKTKKWTVCALAAMLAAETALCTPFNVLADDSVEKHETVYVFTDAQGNVDETQVTDWLKNIGGVDEITDSTTLKGIENIKGDETFTENGGKLVWKSGGNDIYYQGTTNQALPVSVKLTYLLDGRTVTPEEIAGANGEVTIRVAYQNTEKSGDSYVPFMMVTGILMPSSSVSGVKVDHGTVISEGNNTIAVCYGFPGMQENLDEARAGIDEDTLDEDASEKLDAISIPESAEITMRAEDFKESMVMTFALSDILSDEDGSVDLGKIEDKAEDTIGELTDASSKLKDGTQQLSDGLQEANDKLPEFTDGMNELENGVEQYTDGVAQVAEGASALKAGTSQLRGTVDSFASDKKQLQEIGSTASKAAKKTAEESAKQQVPELKKQAGAAAEAQAKNSVDAQAKGAAQQAGAAAEAQAKNSVDTQAKGAAQQAAAAAEAQAKNSVDAQAKGAAQQAGAAAEAQTKNSVDAQAKGAAQQAAAAAKQSASQNIDAQAEGAAQQAAAAAKQAASKNLDDQAAAVGAQAARQAMSQDYSEYTKLMAQGINSSVNQKISETMTEKLGQAKQAAQSIDVSSGASNIYAAIEAGTMSEEEAVAAITQLAQAAASGTVDQIAAGMGSVDITKQVEDGLKDPVNTIAAAVAEQTAENVYKQAVPAAAEQAASQTADSVVRQAVPAAAEQAAAQTADSVVRQAVPEAAKQAAAQTADSVVRQAVPEAAKQAAAQTADSVVRQAVPEAAKQAASQTADSVVRQAVPETAKQTAESVIEQSAVETAGTVASQVADEVAQEVAVQVVDNFKDGAAQLDDGAGQLEAGAKKLNGSSSELISGVQQLAGGADTLADGVAQLLAGSIELKDGMAKFDEEGIQKVADLYDKDMKPLMESFENMKAAAGSYKSYSGAADGMKSSVRFIIKSEEIG